MRTRLHRKKRLTDRMTCFFLLTVPIQIVSMISKVILKRQNTMRDLVTYALSCRTLLPPAKYCLICLTGIRFPLNARRIFTWVLFMIPVYSSIPIQQEKRWRPQVLYLKKAFILKISLTGHFTRSPMCRIRFLAVH